MNMNKKGWRQSAMLSISDIPTYIPILIAFHPFAGVKKHLRASVYFKAAAT